MGRFELAHQGTLFLDEIAELNKEMQSKLLHVLEDHCFERVGESVSFSVDVRLVAATNVNIKKAISEKRLRSDFYYRLSSCIIEIPPLRKRREEIPALSTFFMAQSAKQYSLPQFSLSKAILDKLCSHSWPGNVRELRNVITSLLIKRSISGPLSEHDVEEALGTDSINAGKISISYAEESEDKKYYPKDSEQEKEGNAPDKMTLENVEREHILHVLTRTNGVISGPKGAAKILGMSRSTLQRRIIKFGLFDFSSE